MNTLLHPLWDPPPRDAPPLQQQAYRYMLKSLCLIESRVPGILDRPDEVSGAQVMEAACATLLNPKIPSELRTGALTMLQRRMCSVDDETPKRLYLARDPHRSPIAPNFGDQLAALAAFERALYRFLVMRAADKPASRPDASDSSAAALLHLGILEALLVTRVGCCASAVLAQVGAKAGEKPCVYANWAWLDLEVPGSGAAPQLRRLFLDPVTLAAWLALQPYAASLLSPAARLKAGKRASFRAQLARKAFKTLVAAMTEADCTSPIQVLRNLCAAEVQRLYVTTMPLLATYANGEVASSSLHPETWARMLGCTPPADAEPRAADGASEDSDATALPSDVHARKDTSPSEAATQGDLDEDGLIAKLREVMRAPRTAWQQGFDTLIGQLPLGSEAHGTARCVVSWLRYLTVEYQSKGKRLRDGSIAYYRGLLANRLLEHLPTSLDGIGEDELHDAYAAVLQSRTSDGQLRNLRMALGAFDRYVREKLYPELPHTRLLATGEGAYTVSNRIVSVAEYQAGLRQIDDGSLVIANETLRAQLRAFWILAFRLGMRRREILGLQVRDIDDPFVWVRKNPGRTLKTPNARRLLTLEPLPESEQRAVSAVVPEPSERRARGRDYVFFGPTTPTAAALDAHPVVALANTLMERITGDRHLHPHNLRHSFASLYLLGSLGEDLGLAAHPCTLPFMRDAMNVGGAMAKCASGSLHRMAARGAALGMLMGHGAERTTYEHYVHCLDLLLFVACTHPDRPQRQGSAYHRLAADRAEIRALLGCPPSYRLTGKHLFTAVPRILKSRPEALMQLQQHEAPQRPATCDDAAPRDDWLPSLNALCADPFAQNLSGCPGKQAERDAAEALLSVLRRVPSEQHERLASVLSRWADARMKNSDWASMTAAAARAWAADVSKLGVALKLEVRQVTRKESGDVKQLRPLPDPCDSRAYRDQTGRYWIRFADARRRRTRSRKRETGRRRSGMQAAISWLVCVLHDVNQPGNAGSRDC